LQAEVRHVEVHAMNDEQARVIIQLLGSIRNILLGGFAALAILIGIAILRLM
jgi:hypothetical protein